MSASVAKTCAAMLAPLSLTMWLMSRRTPGTFWCTLRMRCLPGVGGSVDLRKVHRPRGHAGVHEADERPPTSRPMASCASAVDPPMCGVKMTFADPEAGS